ncbi:drug resistance protein [Xylariaceae sp. FL0662B]|nr:drug resistance protein [Xylariaceae sp. FL0662B]
MARCIALVVIVTGASFLISVVIILPTIGQDLSISNTNVYGNRLIFIMGSAVVAATMIANPFIRNEIGSNLSWGLQELGAAAHVLTAIGILSVTFPLGRAKNFAFGAYAAGTPFGSVFGNLIAGFIASSATLKWVCGATGRLAIIVTATGMSMPLPPSPVAEIKAGVSVFRTVDWLRGTLITAGILALEKHIARKPPMKVFKNPRFRVAILLMALFAAAFNHFILYVTYFFQGFQGFSALESTLRFIPTGACGLITAFVVGDLMLRVPTWMVLLPSNIGVSISCILFSAPIRPDTSYFAFALPAVVILVAGADMNGPCLTLFTSKSLPQDDYALGNALINAMGQIGRAIGLAVTTAIKTTTMARERGVSVEESGEVILWGPTSLASLRGANWFNIALAICCTIIVCVAFRGTGIIGLIEKHPESRVS